MYRRLCNEANHFYNGFVLLNNAGTLRAIRLLKLLLHYHAFIIVEQYRLVLVINWCLTVNSFISLCIYTLYVQVTK